MEGAWCNEVLPGFLLNILEEIRIYDFVPLFNKVIAKFTAVRKANDINKQTKNKQ